MKNAISHTGYVFLVSVLVLGTIAATTALSGLLLGWAAEQNGVLLMQSTQAQEYARTCAERALRALRADPSYGGDEQFSLTKGSCLIRAIEGSGNFDRVICAQGVSGPIIRRIEVSLASLFPRASIASWKEVPSFTLCP